MIRYSIRINLAPRCKKNGTHALRLRVSWKGGRVERYLGHSIKEADWDPVTCMPKKNQQRALKEIRELSEAVDRLFDKCHIEHRSPSTSEVEKVMNKVDELPPPPVVVTHNILDALDEFIKESRQVNGWSIGTAKRWGVIRNHIKRWNKKVTIEDIDEKKMLSLMENLQRQKLRNTTIVKDLSWLRWFLRWCRQKGYTTNSRWEDFKPRLKETEKEVIYLTEEELHDVMDLDLYNTPYLERVRDVFIFCCFTGLRYSDVEKLRKSDIHGDYISVVTQKTSDPLKIELNNVSRAILNKYDGWNDKEHKALPIISNQKMNDYLKELARKAGINDPIRKVYWVGSERIEEVRPKWEFVTTHCGRRTFVVTALQLEIPAEVIMRWTGHSSHAAMKPYIAIVDKQKKESMDRFNNLISAPVLHPKK